jgi:hypothetical protein
VLIRLHQKYFVVSGRGSSKIIPELFLTSGNCQNVNKPENFICRSRCSTILDSTDKEIGVITQLEFLNEQDFVNQIDWSEYDVISNTFSGNPEAMHRRFSREFNSFVQYGRVKIATVG